MPFVASNLMPMRQFERPDGESRCGRACSHCCARAEIQVVTPRPALDARFFLDPWGVAGLSACAALSAGREHLAMQSREDLRGAIVGAQAEDQAPPVL